MSEKVALNITQATVGLMDSYTNVMTILSLADYPK